MKNTPKKVLLSAIIFGLVVGVLAPAAKTEAAGKNLGYRRVQYPIRLQTPLSAVSSPVSIKPQFKIKTYEPEEEKPKPIRLLVEWGNLDGYVAQQASGTTNYEGYVEAVTGDTQLRVVRPYRYELMEDSFIQRTGKKIEFNTDVHGHKDGLIISVGNYKPGEKTHLKIAMNGDVRHIIVVELNDLISRGGHKFNLDVEGKDYTQSLEVKALGQE